MIKEIRENAEEEREELLEEFEEGELDSEELKQKLEEIEQKLSEKLSQEKYELAEELVKIDLELSKTKKVIHQELSTIKKEKVSEVEDQPERLEMKESKEKEKGILVKKNDKRVQELLKSESPDEEAWKLGLDYKDGKTKLVLELSETSPEVLEKIEALGEVDIQNDNLVQITTSIDNLPRINSIDSVEKTRTPYSLSDYEPTISEGILSPMVELTTDETVFHSLESMIEEEWELEAELENEEENIIQQGLTEFEMEISKEIEKVTDNVETIISDYKYRSIKDTRSFDYNHYDYKIEASHELSNVYTEHEQELTKHKQSISEEIQKIETDPNANDNDKKRLDRLVQLNSKIEKLEEIEKVIVKQEISKDTKSEGMYYSNVDIVHNEGITGNDVKIAVLDLVFDLNNPKISDNIVESKSFRSGLETTFVAQDEKGANKIAHGTAVAEIVTEIAPDSDLYLYEMDTDVEFAAAIDQAIENNVDVIAMAAGWPNLPTDGSSHITKKVEEAISHGITFVVPSGNFAKKHWEGNYNDPNLNGWHEFTNNDEGLSINVPKSQVLNEKPIIVYLNWDDGKGDVSDLDLVLVDPAGQIVEFSANPQKASLDQKSEYVFHMPEIEGVYAIGISYAGKLSATNMPDHTNIELFSVNNDIEYPVTSSSVVVPADAKGAIVVGAINTQDGSLEPFSSQGPTNHGTTVPHVVGPDGVTTVAYNGELFYGTSATTPYVAGIAALLIGTNSDISPDELLSTIQENAYLDNSMAEQQNAFGHGTVDALFLLHE